MKESKHDQHLRRFEHSRALDCVLRPFFARRYPDVVVAVMAELRRRGALRPALAGRDPAASKEVAAAVNFVGRHIGEPRHADTLVHVAETLLGEVTSNRLDFDLAKLPTSKKLAFKF